MKVTCMMAALLLTLSAQAQIGRRFPSERKVVKDPVTGTSLTFLTSTAAGDSKIYQTHNQWTSDGHWLIFRSNRVKGEAMAVNEKTGVIVQVTEGGYTGMLNVARNSMKLYFLRNRDKQVEIVEVDLEKLFKDSETNRLQPANAYQRVCGSPPPEIGASGDLALDGDENWAYFRIGKEEAARRIAPGTKIETAFGPRNMGAGPSGIAAMNVHTGEVKHVIAVPFQVGHIQTNPWQPGEIVFCWETGGKSPQRTWTVMSDGSGLRPLYPESEHEWVTHEAVITKDEVAFALMGHRKIPNSRKEVGAGTTVEGANPGQEAAWGPSGTREKPTGLAIVNLRTREVEIAGQTKSGSGLWHVSGSADGHWAVGDDFGRNIYLIDRHTREMRLLSTGHKTTAADHPHPTMSPDGTKIQIQSAMLSADGRSMNICIIPVPKDWLKRYGNRK
ncbi:conotoxin [Chitinophaga horti]|uniref:Conotoxin n=1 Tax=Chitinophaga horti TaxID=2920382 RepID=A0ABY6J2C6_9BACT|nr:conotoxin [Chitinophaga horti]UYQ93780.1 conotoxin [Chitinophaga horti]